MPVENGENMLDASAAQEKKEKASEVVIVACMDEDIDYEDGMLVAGVAGSAVTNLEGGNTEFFPIEKRKRVESLRPALFKALELVAGGIDKKVVATSHLGCGWLKAQGVMTAEDMASVTKSQMESMSVPYVGHIDHSESPVELGESGLKAHIGRPESDHHHGAKSIVITTDGFITESEIKEVSTEYGDSFIISADWVGAALENKLMTEDDAMFLIDLQVQVAKGIAEDVRKAEGNAIKFHAGKRLDSATAAENMRVAQKALSADL